MLGQDGAAPAGVLPGGSAPAPPAVAVADVACVLLTRARAPEGVQPAQAAALERDHARPAQVGDARDLGPRVGLRRADAGAQREHAALGPRHARQAALEAQDGAPQGAIAAADLRGAAVVVRALGRAARALWPPAPVGPASDPVDPPGVVPVGGRGRLHRSQRSPPPGPSRTVTSQRRGARRSPGSKPAGVETDGTDPEGVDIAGVETDGTDTAGVRTGTLGAGR